MKKPPENYEMSSKTEQKLLDTLKNRKSNVIKKWQLKEALIITLLQNWGLQTFRFKRSKGVQQKQTLLGKMQDLLYLIWQNPKIEAEYWK